MFGVVCSNVEIFTDLFGLYWAGENNRHLKSGDKVPKWINIVCIAVSHNVFSHTTTGAGQDFYILHIPVVALMELEV